MPQERADELWLDPAGEHRLGPGPACALRSRDPRSPLHAALEAGLERRAAGAERLASLAGRALGRWTPAEGWRAETRLTAFETRFLADRRFLPPAPGLASAPVRLRTDLHTHFAGCVRGADLVRIGAAHEVVYPAALLLEAGIGATQDLPLREAPEALRAALARALALPVDAPCTHQDMDRVYRLRRPLTKHGPAFPDLCRQIARDYAAMGVEYAELSLYDILEPERLRAAHDLLPALRAETGVDLRFLAAFSRHDDLEWDLDLLERLRAYAGSELLVGIDVMGHETNSTRAIVPHLRAVSAFVREVRPDYVVRVHAGENAGYPENVPVAVETLLAEGVSEVRIGHGLYGVDEATLERIVAAGVVVELNLDSNYALNNVREALQVPLARYLAAGAPLVLGTDGYGIYHGDLPAQLRVAGLTGLSDPGPVLRTEEALLARRRAADAALAGRGAFRVPVQVPPARHWTAALAAQRQAEQAARAAALRDAVARSGAELVVSAELDRRWAGRPWVSIAGAWQHSWARLEPATQARIEDLLEALVAGLARAGAVLVTGGTRHGVEGRVHAAARRHGATVLGALTGATPPADLDRVAAWCLVGETLYDKGCGLYRLLAERGGSALFVGGGPIVLDELRIAANLRLPRLFLADVPGASGEAAARWPRHAFRSAEEALARLERRGPRPGRGGAYYHPGPNPSADVVCLRRHPARGQLELVLVRRRGDLGAEAGRWALPGGFVRSAGPREAPWSPGAEAPAAAALRELAEETGLELEWLATSLRAVGVYEGGGRDPRDSATRWSRSHAWLLELPPHLALTALLGGEDACEARWFAVEELPPLAFDHARIVRDALILSAAAASRGAPPRPGGPARP